MTNDALQEVRARAMEEAAEIADDVVAGEGFPLWPNEVTKRTAQFIAAAIRARVTHPLTSGFGVTQGITQEALDELLAPPPDTPERRATLARADAWSEREDDRIGCILVEYAERLQNGERPDWGEYVDRIRNRRKG